MKKIMTILLMVFAVAMVSCFNERITGNGGNTGNGDNPPKPEDSIKLTLADFDGMTTLPTENVWVITDTTGTSDNFDGLNAVLRLNAATSREIKLEFPNLDEIPNYIFLDNSQDKITSLVSVSANKATTIGNNAFESCSALTTVDFPYASTINERAFEDCSALTTVVFPNTTIIGSYTFKGCSDLTTANFPNTTIIRSDAFYKCNALKTMTIATDPIDTITIDANAFRGVDVSKIKLTTGNQNNKDIFIGLGFISDNITIVN